MVWDGLIVLVITIFAMAGWSAGLLRSWTVPVAMIFATLVSQLVYVDLSATLAENLQLEPTLSVFLSYVFTWLWIVQYSDSFLSHIVRVPDGSRNFFLKFGGGLLGFSKGLAAFVLAAMVSYGQTMVPEPAELCWANRWLVRAASGSRLLPGIHHVACRLDEPLGKYVLSDSAPRFHPNFELVGDPFESIRARQEKKGEDFVKGWQKFQRDFSGL
jgi:uncharacterized membrane protein required for colicin V production